MTQTKPMVSIVNVVASASVDQRIDLNDITKKFPEGFRDYKLEDKVVKFWIEKNLPITNIRLDTNIVKVPADIIAKTKIAPDLSSKLDEMEQKVSKLRKKKYY